MAAAVTSSKSSTKVWSPSGYFHDCLPLYQKWLLPVRGFQTYLGRTPVAQHRLQPIPSTSPLFLCLSENKRSPRTFYYSTNWSLKWHLSMEWPEHHKLILKQRCLNRLNLLCNLRNSKIVGNQGIFFITFFCLTCDLRMVSFATFLVGGSLILEGTWQWWWLWCSLTLDQSFITSRCF